MELVERQASKEKLEEVNDELAAAHAVLYAKARVFSAKYEQFHAERIDHNEPAHHWGLRLCLDEF